MGFISLNNLVTYLFDFIFMHDALLHRGYSTPSSALNIWEFAVVFCCENLPKEFTMGIRRRSLPWLFVAGICRVFFVYVNKSFFVYFSKSCLYRSKPFLHGSKTFLFVRFSFLTAFLFVIVVAVMCHRI